MKKTRKNRNKKIKTKKNYGGGPFDTFGTFGSKSQPLSTQEEYNMINNEVGNVKLQDFESKIKSLIDRLPTLRNNCVTNCKSNICSKNDEIMCKQINDMMIEKTDYEWGNLCNNLNVQDCKTYLSAIKRVEIYTNYLKNLNDVSQMLLSDYKNTITPQKR